MRSTYLRAAWVWVFGGGVTLGLASFGVAQEAKPEGATQVKEKGSVKDLLFPFTISKETTRITEPLSADGLVDYAAALNARKSAGLKPEDNAGVLLMQAFGAQSIPEANRERYYKALGIAVPASDQGTMQDLGQYIREHLESQGKDTEDTEAFTPFWNEQHQAMTRPWTRKEFPIVAKWVDANAETLKLALDAAQKPTLFFPLVPPANESLLTVTLDSVQNMRELARLLTARAMLALGEGQIAEAQQHLLACHRLASLLGQQSTIIEAFVAYALDAVACRADLALAVSDKVTAAQLAAYRQKLADLSPLPKMSDNIDHGERFFALDVLSHLATQKLDGDDLGFPNSTLFKKMMGLTIDWDSIMKRFNQEYDDMAAALRLESYAERAAELDKFAEELKKLQKEIKDPITLALMIIGVNTPRELVSRQMGNILLAMLVPAFRQATDAETRTNVRRDQTVIAFALEEHKREHGQYPDSLDALAPKYLESLPDDRFTGKPLKYQRTDKGYLLYSIGANGQDDQGQDRTANPDSDDWSIRVPIPPEL